MEVDINLIKKLREETSCGVMDAKNALIESNGNYEIAKELIFKKGLARAEKRADREANEGIVYSYIHNGGKIGSMIVLTCETDFVAKTEDFSKVAKEIALQVSTDDYQDLESLLNSPYMRDESKKLSDIVAELSAKTGEKVELKKFVRFAI
jgi:elongation factor Ts